MYKESSSVETAKASEIDACVGALKLLADEVENGAIELAQRLRPVLPSDGDPEARKGLELHSVKSPLGYELNDIAHKLHDIKLTIREILRDLAV